MSGLRACGDGGMSDQVVEEDGVVGVLKENTRQGVVISGSGENLAQGNRSISVLNWPSPSIRPCLVQLSSEDCHPTTGGNRGRATAKH